MTTEVNVELAWAYIRGQKVIEAFDRREASAQLRSIALDRELERRKARSVKWRGGPATVIEGDFSEAAE
jgi:hypothetical protein